MDLALDEIKTYISDGWGGRALALYQTSVTDRAILRVFAGLKHMPGFAVFATGSYGRQEMCPFSDVDIMVFARDHGEDGLATTFFYDLWDTGLRISHAFRTPAECLEEALADARTRTAMLEARFVCGNEAMNRVYQEEVVQKIRVRKRKEYLSVKLREIHERHRNQGNSPFLLQPDIKESRGGLRDIHNALWLTAVLFKYTSVREFELLIPREDFRKFLKAFDFLLRLRFVIHILSRRKNDRLLYEIQEAAAGMLGLRQSKKFSAVERMMRLYFIKAKTVSTAMEKIYRICGEAVAPNRAVLSAPERNALVPGPQRRMVPRDEARTRRNPVQIVEAFYLHATRGYPLSEHQVESIRRQALFFRADHRTKPEIVRYLRLILASPRVYATLRLMHETGILDRLIPEFGSVRYLMVNDYFHTYPVDEHSLMCIKHLSDLLGSKDERRRGIATMLRSFQRKDLLYLALLLHDTGKSKGRHHEAEGYRNVLRVSGRLMLDREEHELVTFLVRNHLLMAETALKHDVDAPAIIAAFAEKAGTVERLCALYLVTYADMASVSDSFWTEWRASLLRSLYAKTEAYLKGIRIDGGALRDDLRRKYGIAVAAFIDALPGEYLVSVPAERIGADHGAYQRALRDGCAVDIERRSDGTAEITIVARDRRGLFADIVSVFAVRRLNIFGARLFTSQAEWAVDRFRISNWSELWWEGMDAVIREELAAVILRGKKIEIRDEKRKGREVAAFVSIDNEQNRDYSVVEIMAADRLGFLHAIATILSDLGVNIISGRIATEQGVVNDLLYVSEEGRSLNAERTLSVMSRIWERVKR